MSDDYAFLFEADDVFGLVGHGPVFNGRVLQGSAAPGDIVHLIDSSIEATGTIKFIESERQLLERTSPAIEIGILLHNPKEAEFDGRGCG